MTVGGDEEVVAVAVVDAAALADVARDEAP